MCSCTRQQGKPRIWCFSVKWMNINMDLCTPLFDTTQWKCKLDIPFGSFWAATSYVCCHSETMKTSATFDWLCALRWQWKIYQAKPISLRERNKYSSILMLPGWCFVSQGVVKESQNKLLFLITFVGESYPWVDAAGRVQQCQIQQHHCQISSSHTLGHPRQNNTLNAVTLRESNQHEADESMMVPASCSK